MVQTEKAPIITRLYRCLQWLNLQRHLYSIRTAFITMMPVMIVGAYAVALNNLPIPAYQQFMEHISGPSWRSFGELAFHSTTQIATLMVVFLIGSNLAQWYNSNRQADVHAGSCGMISLACYLAMSLPVWEASAISFATAGVTGLFGAMLVGVASGELFIRLCRAKKFLYHANDDPDVAVPMAFASVIPAIIVIFGFVALRMGIVVLGVSSELTDLINNILRMPYESNSPSVGTAILYNLSSHLMWLFGIHGNNVLESVAQGVFAQAPANGASKIITKTFFDVFVYMGGSGTTLALLLSLLLFGRNRSYRTLLKFALPNSIFNINEPLIFGIPIVLNPVFAIPFVLTPCVMFFTAYLAISLGWVPPILHEVSWATPVLISGYAATRSVAGIVLQLFNLTLATAIYTPFVRLSETLSEMRFKSAYQELVRLVTTEYTASSRGLLLRMDELGAVARRLANELEGALESGEMFLHYQPVMNVRENRMHSVEALLRWRHRAHGMVNSMLVVALAEEMQLVGKLGIWVVEQAMLQRAQWTRAGLGDFRVAVNISNQQLNEVNFHQQVLSILKRLDIPPSQLQVEITETVALVENQATCNNLTQLNAAGIDIAMDDFGVGHSSLIYLRTMPIHTLKIDSSLSQEILKHPATMDIIAAIYDLCRLMQIDTIVEHVDSREQLDKLMQVGEFLIQGYLFSPPLSGEEIPRFLRELEMSAALF